MSKTKILVVEDELITAKVIGNALKSLGYDVLDIVTSGEEAIQKASEVRPDLILMDIKLYGKIDGIESARQIKDRFSIPVVYLTAHTDGATLERAKIAEPYGYIIKPFEDRELHIAVEIALFRHKTEVKLKESEEKFRSIVTSVFDAIIMMDNKGEIIFWNEAAEKVFGYPKEEAIGKDLHKLIVPERFHEDYLKGLEEFKKSGTGGIIGKITSMHGLKKDGKEFFAEHSFSSVNIKGKWQAISVIRDITERKQIGEELRKSEQHYRSIFENAMDGIGLCTPEGTIVSSNDALLDIIGYSREELLTMRYQELTPPEYHEMEAEKVKMLIETGEVQEYEKEHIRKDGTRVPLLLKVSAICDDNGKPRLLLAVIKDMTKIKQAENMLNEQKKDLEQKNIALSEVLGQIELEKKHIKDNVIANAENLLLPVIQRLRLKGESRKYVQLLKKNIQELTSSFGAKLTEKRAKLTSREIEICNMIKNGLTNKEIAGLLDISQGTIERHRANIRKKLGLIKKDINLSSFLKTL